MSLSLSLFLLLATGLALHQPRWPLAKCAPWNVHVDARIMKPLQMQEYPKSSLDCWSFFYVLFFSFALCFYGLLCFPNYKCNVVDFTFCDFLLGYKANAKWAVNGFIIANS